ncbi:MAG: metal-sensitive transcriptional regulator [Sulfobacillus sp.]
MAIRRPPSQYNRDNEALMVRLRRIEGQVRGIQRMVDEDRYCVDILIQIAAVKAAVDKVASGLLEGHVRGCVAKAITEGHGDQAVSELMEVVGKLRQ